MTRVPLIALGSIAIGVAVLALKYAAYWLTGSVALWSDAIESIVNVATAIVAWLTIRWSAKPADEEHPYGHHKAEYFSAVFEGVLIVLAALLILHEAYQAYLAPRILDAPWPGVALNLLASCLNGVWAVLLLGQGKRHRSPALIADGWHLVTDVMSSAGVLIGVVIAALSGLAVLDPLLAALVALNILWAGWRLMRESLSGLLDEAIPAETLLAIRSIISINAEGAIEAHDIRTRRAGAMTFIDFHLVVAGTTTVSDAHDICDRLERAIRDEVGASLITIHVEPDNKAKHSGIVVL
jgi:cation diffusion facilitator family transporter